jgi:hypothetical protein
MWKEENKRERKQKSKRLTVAHRVQTRSDYLVWGISMGVYTVFSALRVTGRKHNGQSESIRKTLIRPDVQNMQVDVIHDTTKLELTTTGTML